MPTIGRNEPCPCGSGKKYKHCHGRPNAARRDDAPHASRPAGAPPTGPNPATDSLEALKAAMTDHTFESLEEAQAFASSMIDDRNSTPDDDFHGISPEQMHRLLSAPLEAHDLLEVPEVLDAEPEAPILDLVMDLADALGGDGLPATSKGNLPQAFCREAAERYFREKREFFDGNLAPKVQSEEDFRDLHVARRVARLAGLIRLHGGRWDLTRKGRELLDRHGPAGIHPALLRAFVERFPWTPDGEKDPLNILQASWPFTAWLLHRHGNEWRPSEFYEDAFIRAFPPVVDAAAGARSWRPDPSGRDAAEATARNLYRAWVLQDFAGFLGLARVERELVRDPELLRDPELPRVRYHVQALPLLQDAVRFRIGKG